MPEPWGGTRSFRLFGWLVCVMWPPHEQQDPGFPSRILLCREAIVVVSGSMFWLISVSSRTNSCLRLSTLVYCNVCELRCCTSDLWSSRCSIYFPLQLFVFPVSLLPFLSVRGICCLETQLTHKHAHKVFLLSPLCAVGHFLCRMKITKGESDRPKPAGLDKICIMWLLGLLMWEIHKYTQRDAYSKRPMLSLLLSLSAHGYEEHSMDAADSQHYKEVTFFFFFLVIQVLSLIALRY